MQAVHIRAQPQKSTDVCHVSFEDGVVEIHNYSSLDSYSGQHTGHELNGGVWPQTKFFVVDLSEGLVPDAGAAPTDDAR